MTYFYTNAWLRGDKIYVRGYNKGIKFKEVIEYKPYMFLLNKAGTHQTLDGRKAAKMQFESIRDAKDFVERYSEVSNMDVYGFNNFLYLYIYDTFKGNIDYDPKMVSIGTLDIECAADEGFPNIQKADKPITAITVRSRGRNYVFGCGDFYTEDKNTYYLKCKDEEYLLLKFLEFWRSIDLDIVTGWNIEFFDIPYLINRMKNVLSEKAARTLSPYNIMFEKTVEFRGKENQSYDLAGISVLDYYQLYRKFSFGNQESYKLDYIANVELGEKKIDYSEYGNLLELYKNNYQKFIEYNIHDCVLVDRLEDKLKFLEQVMALAYDAKVNYEDTLTTVRAWDTIIHNYLLDQNIVIPQFKKQSMDEPLVGGHVKEPRIGLSKWIVSFDLNSLYPHLIMQYNISPETFVGRTNMPTIDQLKDGIPLDLNLEHAYAANGCYYKRDKQGFLPALMEKMYDDRAIYKKKMIEAKKELEIVESEMKKRGLLAK